MARRATSISVSNVAPYIGDSVTVNISPGGSGTVYDVDKFVLTYTVYGTTTVRNTIGTFAETVSANWTIPVNLYQFINESATCEVKCEAYRGNTYVETATAQITVNGFNKNPVTAKVVSGSSAAVIPASGIDMGSTVRFAIERYGGMTSVTLRYKFTGKSTAQNTIAAGSTGTSLDWVAQHNNGSASSPSYVSFGTFCPDRTSGSLAITVESNLNSTVVRTDTITIKLNAPTSWIPTISSVSASEMASAVLDSGMGIYLKGESRVRLLASGASGSNGSTIAGYRFVFDGSVYTTSGSANNAVTTDTLKSSGALTYRVTVTDTRGRTSAEKTGTLTAYDYAKPSITTAFKAERCNSDGSAYQSDGTKVRVTFGASYSKLTVSGTNKNSLQVCQVAWSTGGNYTGDSKTFTISTSEGTATANNTLLNGTYSNTTRYTLRLTVQDKMYSVTAVVTIPTQLVTLDFKSNGLGFGIGMMSQNNYTIDSAWTYKGTSVQLSSRVEIGASAYIDAFRVWNESFTDMRANAVLRADNTWQFTEYTTAGADPREIYLLPAPTSTNASGDWYDILTSKNAVTVAQGGTGATTAAGARTNLGLGSMATESTSDYLPISGGSLTGALTLANAGLNTANIAGFTLNQYGNFIHRRNTATDTWNIMANDNSVKIAITPETGATTFSGQITANSGLTVGSGRLWFTNRTDGTDVSFLRVDGATNRLEMYSQADHSVAAYVRAAGSTYYERYILPAPSTSLTAHKYYTIATSKSLQTGRVASANRGAGSSSTAVTITFPTPYTSTPVVMTQMFGTYNHQCNVMISNVTATGFTYGISNSASSAYNFGFMWMAFGNV